MTPPPILLLILLAVGLVLCRPWLEARRPSVAVGLACGAVLGWAAGGPAGGWLDAATARALAAIPAGWLALSAGAAWDTSAPGRAGHRGRAWLPAAAAAVLAAAPTALILLFGFSMGALDASAPSAIALLAALCFLALDPAAARASLERLPRPSPAARLGPRTVSFWLGLAMAGGALAWCVGPPGSGAGFTLWPAAASLLLGLSAGLAGMALLRAAQGSAFLITVTASMVAMTWALARWMEVSPLAALVVAGVVIARDTARRDLAGTVMQELESPAAVLLSLAAGAWAVTVGGPAIRQPAFWMTAAAIGLAAPLAWRAIAARDMRAMFPLSLSPLAAAVAMEAGDPVRLVRGILPPGHGGAATMIPGTVMAQGAAAINGAAMVHGAAVGIVAAVFVSDVLHASCSRRAVVAAGEPRSGGSEARA